MATPNTTVVLAHGAWADGSSWGRVVAGLRAAGVPSLAAPLPLTSLADDIAALSRVLERVAGPVVLAGHAYAGAVIGGVQAAKARALVYVAALAPDEGETVAEVFHRAPPRALAPRLQPDAHGLIWLPEDAFASAFAPNATAEEQALLHAVQRPILPACITVPAPRPLWKDRPSWFLVAENDRMIARDAQDFMAGRMGAAIRRGPLDHTPLVTAPDAVVQIVLEAVHGG